MFRFLQNLKENFLSYEIPWCQYYDPKAMYMNYSLELEPSSFLQKNFDPKRPTHNGNRTDHNSLLHTHAWFSLKKKIKKLLMLKGKPVFPLEKISKSKSHQRATRCQGGGVVGSSHQTATISLSAFLEGNTLGRPIQCPSRTRRYKIKRPISASRSIPLEEHTLQSNPNLSRSPKLIRFEPFNHPLEVIPQLNLRLASNFC